MIRVAPLTVALACALVGCGRVGYEPRPERVADDARPDGPAMAEDAARAERPDAALPLPALDGGADRASPQLDAAIGRDAAPPPPIEAGVPGRDGGGGDVAGGADAPVDRGPGPSTDAPTAGLACRTRHPDALACWDFDDPALVLPTYSGGRGTRDPARAAAGPASLRVVTNADASVVAYDLNTTIAPPIASGSLYLRAHFFVPSTTTIADWLVPMEAKSGLDAKTSLDVGPGGVGIHVSPNATYGGQLPRDRWFCAEIQIDVDRRAGRARLLVDGALRAEMRDVDTLLDKGYDFFRVGAIVGEKNGALEYWIDEVLVTRTPVGCR